jgi:AbrB family looped-hinge helix DNA binding protein
MSKKFSSVVTRKGQITIPAEVRHSLRLEVGDQVALVLEGEQVCLTRTGSVVARTAGLLKSARPPLSAEALRETAERAIADAVSERGE